MLRFSISTSADNARNKVSSVPLLLHLAKRTYTDCLGPYASGNSRHWVPLRAIHIIPFSTFRLSFAIHFLFPVLSGGSSGLIHFHCFLLIHIVSCPIHSHFFCFCATFIFQTRPRKLGRNYIWIYFC